MNDNGLNQPFQEFPDEPEENTAPIDVSGNTHEENEMPIPAHLPPEDPANNRNQKVERPVKKRRGITILLGFLGLVLLTAIGAAIGYGVAYSTRQKQAQEQIAFDAATQFQLALTDMEAGNNENAKQRLEYILQLDPEFPGAVEKYTEVMMLLAQEKTPTPALPTATIAPTPTKDLRPVEELFNAAQSYLRANDWINAILTIESLRTADLTYRAIDVDGMYYIALRGRGIQKILQEGNLEGGIYDLTLVERFGPLDREAEGYRAWARAYLQGASFWKVDWEKVVTYFSQIYPAVPSLRDADGWTAAERYRYALIQYGNKLLETENFCGARDAYQLSLSIGNDPAIGPTATFAQLQCEPPTPTPAPFTPTPTLTMTEPTLEVTPDASDTGGSGTTEPATPTP
jgi:tetratricopeptide (TPR) repeat protein